MGLVVLHCQFRLQFLVCRTASLLVSDVCNSARIIAALSMTNRKDPLFAWVFDLWKRCADELPGKRLSIWNSSNCVPHPPLIPPPVSLSEGDKGGGKVPSPLVGEGLGEGYFRVNTIKIWATKKTGEVEKRRKINDACF